MSKIPHPFPYQGSKRRLAPRILARLPASIDTFYEPFAGSAAITLAIASRDGARRFVLSDLNENLCALWRAILDEPGVLSDRYEQLWLAQMADPQAHYQSVRSRFNRSGDAADFLFLLARCVKAAVRYNSKGEFNNSPDKRRLGMRPTTMRRNLLAVSSLLAGRTEVTVGDFSKIAERVRPQDFVYMDPPYQGVTGAKDNRYVTGFDEDAFVTFLSGLRDDGVPFAVSYDGRSGDRTYGRELPIELDLVREEIPAGRSSQATLLGRDGETVESLYLPREV